MCWEGEGWGGALAHPCRGALHGRVGWSMMWPRPGELRCRVLQAVAELRRETAGREPWQSKDWCQPRAAAAAAVPPGVRQTTSMPAAAPCRLLREQLRLRWLQAAHLSPALRQPMPGWQLALQRPPQAPGAARNEQPAGCMCSLVQLVWLPQGSETVGAKQQRHCGVAGPAPSAPEMSARVAGLTAEGARLAAGAKGPACPCPALPMSQCAPLGPVVQLLGPPGAGPRPLRQHPGSLGVAGQRQPGSCWALGC